MEELKEVVTKTLEKQGVLARLRAELRASVFQAIEDEEGSGAIAKKSNNARLKKLLDSPNGVIMVGLVREFMTWAGLSFSLKVFDPEVSLPERPSRESLQQSLRLSHSDDLPLIGALLESFTSGGSQPADRKPSEVGLRGPRPDPLTVASHSIAPTIDRSQSDMSDPAASPYDVTTPSSAFLGQDDLNSVKNNVTPKSSARGPSPLRQAVSASQELEKSEGASFEIEEDELDEDDDFEIEYEDNDDILPLPSDEGPTQNARGSGRKEEQRTSSELHSSSDSVSVPRLEPLPIKSLAPLNPLDKPLLGPPGRATGGLTPLGQPSRPRLSSSDIKQDLLRQGLISPSQSPHTSQELPDVGNRAGQSSGEEGFEKSGITDEVSVEEIDAFDGGASDIGSDISYNAAEDSQTILGPNKGGASMEFFASGLSASDRSGELDAMGDADYLESAEIG